MYLHLCRCQDTQVVVTTHTAHLRLTKKEMDTFCTKVTLGFQAWESSRVSKNDSIKQQSQKLLEDYYESQTLGGDGILIKFAKSLNFHGLSPREMHDLFEDIRIGRTRVLHRKFKTIRKRLINKMNYVQYITALVLGKCIMSKKPKSEIQMTSKKALKEFELLTHPLNDLIDLVTLHRRGLNKRIILPKKIYLIDYICIKSV